MTQVAVGDIHLEVEQDGPAAAPVILLTRGLGTQLIEWPQAFWQGLVEGGFRVVRYDNRDVGLSQKFGPCDVAPGAESLRGKENPPAAYDLYDMAADSVGLLGALGIDKAHILGISMGGMISQIIVARYPARALSLISVMSSAGEANCPGGILRQRAAVMTSGSRADLLRQIACPSLVLHGDEDPLIPVASAERAAELIPGAALKPVAGMGHDLPGPLIPEILEAVLGHCRGAGQRRTD